MKITNKFKFIRSMAILTFILLALFNISIAKQTEKEPKTITYTVCKGETLWSIAKQYTPSNKDIRQTIYEIEKLNNLDNANLSIGDELQIKIEQ